ncbi:MAG: hypothetical protein ACRERC_22060 [Candidatus Binatia bacterium]
MLDFDLHRRRRPRTPGRPQPAPSPAQLICNHCGEPHPIVRLPGGEQRCVTAFFDGTHWFCRNRGCRRAWLESDGG